MGGAVPKRWRSFWCMLCVNPARHMDLARVLHTYSFGHQASKMLSELNLSSLLFPHSHGRHLALMTQ